MYIDNYKNNITCTLVDNLPDIKTESNKNVNLPRELLKGGTTKRLEKELQELDVFSTEHNTQEPKYYIIKWLTDYIRNFGVDGFRVDTVKHVEEEQAHRKEADIAFEEWKANNHLTSKKMSLSLC